MERCELLVVGGGAAGMAAALAAEQAGASSILLAERAEELGGVLPQCLHRGFGLGYFGQDLNGPEYAARFRARMRASRVRVCTQTTVLRLMPDRTALLSGPAGLMRLSFQRCILAAGCRERTLGALPVAGVRPAGVFTAGQAQRMINLGGYDIGETFLILGSGNVGLVMAGQLARQGKRVVALIEQGERLGGLPRHRLSCEQAGIPVRLRSTIDEVLGAQGRVAGAVVRRLDTGLLETLRCDTLVTALGLLPEQELAKPLAQNGRLPAWLTLCGNCRRIHDIVDSATREGELAGAACGPG